MLQSLTLQFDHAEDRLLLRLQEQIDGRESELCLHLTRRVCAQLSRDLKTLAELSAQVPERMAPLARAAVSVAHHEAMSVQVPLRKAPPPLPGTARRTALVLAVATGRRREGGQWVLKFELQGQEPATLTLTEQTLHGVIGLLGKQIAAANWALPESPRVHDDATDDAHSEMLRHFH